MEGSCEGIWVPGMFCDLFTCHRCKKCGDDSQNLKARHEFSRCCLLSSEVDFSCSYLSAKSKCNCVRLSSPRESFVAQNSAISPETKKAYKIRRRIEEEEKPNSDATCSTKVFLSRPILTVKVRLTRSLWGSWSSHRSALDSPGRASIKRSKAVSAVRP